MDLEEINKKIAHIQNHHHAYHLYQLDESHLPPDPFSQFLLWFEDALNANQCNPTIMVLATLGQNDWPNTRVVLLKELMWNKFIFYTNYQSKKAEEMTHQPIIALNFFWGYAMRQVRIRGHIEKISREKNIAYFQTRPRGAKLAAAASAQSTVLNNKTELLTKIKSLEKKWDDLEILCPPHWGGYMIDAFEYEFFQGGQWRVHDRFLYTKHSSETWKVVRLSP